MHYWHLPNLHFVGDEKTESGKMFHVMVMDMLGKSLEDHFTVARSLGSERNAGKYRSVLKRKFGNDCLVIVI